MLRNTTQLAKIWRPQTEHLSYTKAGTQPHKKKHQSGICLILLLIIKVIFLKLIGMENKDITIV